MLQRAKFPRMRFHDLRHGAASWLLGQRMPRRVVMEALGYSRLAVRLCVYTDAMPALLGMLPTRWAER